MGKKNRNRRFRKQVKEATQKQREIPAEQEGASDSAQNAVSNVDNTHQSDSRNTSHRIRDIDDRNLNVRMNYLPGELSDCTNLDGIVATMDVYTDIVDPQTIIVTLRKTNDNQLNVDDQLITSGQEKHDDKIINYDYMRNTDQKKNNREAKNNHQMKNDEAKSDSDVMKPHAVDIKEGLIQPSSTLPEKNLPNSIIKNESIISKIVHSCMNQNVSHITIDVDENYADTTAYGDLPLMNVHNSVREESTAISEGKQSNMQAASKNLEVNSHTLTNARKLTTGENIQCHVEVHQNNPDDYLGKTSIDDIMTIKENTGTNSCESFSSGFTDTSSDGINIIIDNQKQKPNETRITKHPIPECPIYARLHEDIRRPQYEVCRPIPDGVCDACISSRSSLTRLQYTNTQARALLDVPGIQLCNQITFTDNNDIGDSRKTKFMTTDETTPENTFEEYEYTEFSPSNDVIYCDEPYEHYIKDGFKDDDYDHFNSTAIDEFDHSEICDAEENCEEVFRTSISSANTQNSNILIEQNRREECALFCANTTNTIKDVNQKINPDVGHDDVIQFDSATGTSALINKINPHTPDPFSSTTTSSCNVEELEIHTNLDAISPTSTKNDIKSALKKTNKTTVDDIVEKDNVNFETTCVNKEVSETVENFPKNPPEGTKHDQKFIASVLQNIEEATSIPENFETAYEETPEITTKTPKATKGGPIKKKRNPRKKKDKGTTLPPIRVRVPEREYIQLRTRLNEEPIYVFLVGHIRINIYSKEELTHVDDYLKEYLDKTMPLDRKVIQKKSDDTKNS